MRRWSPGSARRRGRSGHVQPRRRQRAGGSRRARRPSTTTARSARLDVGGGREVRPSTATPSARPTASTSSPDAADVAVATSTGAVHVLRTSDGTVDAGARPAPGQRRRRRLRPERPAAGHRRRRAGAAPRSGTTPSTSPIWTPAAHGDVVRRRGGERHRVLVLPGRGRLLAGRLAAGGDVARLHGARHVDRHRRWRRRRRPCSTRHLGTILDVEFSPDGSLLATSSEDGTLRIWDVDGWTLRDEFTTTRRRLLGAGVHAGRLGPGGGRRQPARCRCSTSGPARCGGRSAAPRRSPATWCSRPTARASWPAASTGRSRCGRSSGARSSSSWRATPCPSPTSP